MSSICRKYGTYPERRMQRRIANIRVAIRRCDVERKDWKKRQELQRRAMVLMADSPKYVPRVKWWL